MKSHMLSLIPSFPAEKILLSEVPTAKDEAMDDYWQTRIRQDIAEHCPAVPVAKEVGMLLKRKMEDYSIESIYIYIL